MRLFCLTFVCVFSACIAPGATVLAQDSETQPSKLPVGIVAEQPSEGPFVKVENGFMVPYTAKIPGTEIEFSMVPIAGGKFTMGSPDDEDDREDCEGPQFEVVVEPFWMAKHEVTWAEYKKYMSMDEAFKKFREKGLRRVTSKNRVDAVTAPSSLYDPGFTYSAGDGDDQPAASMTQFAAKQYTKWLSLLTESFYRLPTEAEWEYACRAGTKTAYYFGDDVDLLDEHAWHIENSEDERHPVGQLKPNPWGLYDMYGNVSEWVLDEVSEEGYTHVEAGVTVSAEAAFRKPTKVDSRAVRGGSFELEVEYCRSAARLASVDSDWKDEDPHFPKSPWWFTSSPGLGVGFRIMRPLSVPGTRELRDEFWKADVKLTVLSARKRIYEEGKGADSTVDPKMPAELEKMAEEKLNSKK
ncbi:MAG: formylglycine-generating enzyme family protein [Mariniblastus sp.]